MPNLSPSVSGAPKPALDFRRLFESESGYVLRSLRRLGVTAADVEDMAHEVFLAVYGQLHAFDSARPIRPWLFAFCFRVASHYRRRLRREAPLEAASEPRDPRAGADAVLERAAEKQVVLDALETLELDRRAVFILHELDGTTFPEIAATLGIPLGTAYSRLRLAREDFAAAARRLIAQRGLK
jgi:RNA polymerase sigma-70 factor (ECF subfamily)